MGENQHFHPFSTACFAYQDVIRMVRLCFVGWNSMGFVLRMLSPNQGFAWSLLGQTAGEGRRLVLKSVENPQGFYREIQIPGDSK